MSLHKHDPVHPGQILKLDFLEPMGLSASFLSRQTGISTQQIGRIIHGTRPVGADTALRLAQFFGTSAALWVNLQARFDLDKAEAEKGKQIRASVPRYKAA